MTKSSEAEKFEATMRKLLKVSHTELRAKLDAEKAAKPKRDKKKAGK